MPRSPDLRAERLGHDTAVVRDETGSIVGAATLFGRHREFTTAALDRLQEMCGLVRGLEAAPAAERR